MKVAAKEAETVVEIEARAAIEEIAATAAHVAATGVVAAETEEAAAAIAAAVVDDSRVDGRQDYR